MVVRRVALRMDAGPGIDLDEAVVNAWKTCHRATVFLVERVPSELWAEPAPGLGPRTIRAIAAHLHNARRRWIATLGAEHGIEVPARVDEKTVTRRKLIAALERSNRGMAALFTLGARRGGRLPVTAAYTWRNLPLDLGHLLAYFAAHEGHHRGQIVMLVRQMGRRLPVEVTGGIWQWSRFSRQER